jgi:hypothetical protein
MRRTTFVFAAVAACAFAPACSVFYLFDGRLALAGDSEDWIDPNSQVWFVPRTTTSHGVTYFGFGLGVYPEGGIKKATGKEEIPEGGVINIKPSDAYGFPQAGMNDAGLFFGGAATDAVSTRNGKPLFPGFIIDHAMRTCATVHEALAVIRKFDIGFPQGQVLIGDRLGNSAVIEAGNVVLERSGKYQIITNFRLSSVSNGQISCDRYRRLDQTFSKMGRLSVEFARDAIASVGVRPVDDSLEKRQSGTQYSVVFDMTNGVAHLYNRFDFSRSAQIDVKRETSRGERAVKIADLFANR